MRVLYVIGRHRALTQIKPLVEIFLERGQEHARLIKRMPPADKPLVAILRDWV